MNFKPVTIESACPTITYTFKISNHRDTKLADTLIISFHGEYRSGSAGSPDAGLIAGICLTGVEVFDPFKTIIDFRDLEYNWGDNLDLSFGVLEYHKYVVVVGDKCRKAMSTLYCPEDTDIVDNEIFFDDIEKALEAINKEHDS